MSFLFRLALRLVLMAVIFGLVAHLIPGIHVSGGFLDLLWAAAIFTVVNAIAGPVLRLLSLPVIVLTLGLFLLVVNAVLLALTAWLSSHLSVDSVGAAVLGGFVIAMCSWLTELLFPLRKKRGRRQGAATR